jgi:hypothetical protein
MPDDEIAVCAKHVEIRKTKQAKDFKGRFLLKAGIVAGGQDRCLRSQPVWPMSST